MIALEEEQHTICGLMGSNLTSADLIAEVHKAARNGNVAAVQQAVRGVALACALSPVPFSSAAKGNSAHLHAPRCPPPPPPSHTHTYTRTPR